MKVVIAQIAPVFLDREATVAKVVATLERARAEHGAQLVAFGETLVPAYPLWLCRTDGARFDAADQKAIHARYLREAVCLEEGHLAPICEAAQRTGTAVVLGIAERPLDRGGHSIFCARVFIGADGRVLSVHRKLMPTYEERLAWSTGDGAGLVTHRIGDFSVSGLNCWENWMPLARAALYAAGANLHVMLWPGCEQLTRDITRFVAREGRCFVLSACGLIRPEDLPADFPLRDDVCAAGEKMFYEGGSCAAGPNGEWLVAPLVGEEALIPLTLELEHVLAERQNFDPAGHYARPDVLRLIVNRHRQQGAEFESS